MYEVNEYCCEKLHKTQCYWDGEFHNLQPIKEKLLRLSCKWTDFYASDILIFFEYFNKYFKEWGVREVDFYFRQSGIDNVYLLPDGTEKECFGIPDIYRGRAKLVFDGTNFTLYWEIGNC
jgi:hypothetical protein